MFKNLKQWRGKLLLLVFVTSIVSSAVLINGISADVSITEMSPSEGPVGTEVTVTGEISTENGSYIIYFDETPLAEGLANGTLVSDSFHVPNSTQGGHDVKLYDNSTDESFSLSFTVLTQYNIEGPALEDLEQIQEGADVRIVASVTGEEANQTSRATMTVEDPLNRSYSTPEFLIQTSTVGTWQTTRYFPADFNGGNGTTEFIGFYNLTLGNNATLATGYFSIGLTNATEYHRFQIVNVKAVNYTSEDEPTIRITFQGDLIFTSSPNVTQGVITADWSIRANASLGIYTVEIRALVTDKVVPDIQNFTIVSKSFACQVLTKNLDDEPVEGVQVKANNTVTNSVTSVKNTDDSGIANFTLEAANYIFTAFWNTSSDDPPAIVGETLETSLSRNLTSADNTTINIQCSLVHLKISVSDEKGIQLPLVETRLDFTYIARVAGVDAPINETLIAETSLNGTTVFQNLFTNVNYSLEPARYGQPLTTFTINLTSTTWFNITFPTYQLSVRVFDFDGSPLQQAEVRVFEWSVGSNTTDPLHFQEGITNQDGDIVFNFTFGKYGIRVYIDSVLLNETSVYVVEDPTEYHINCRLYPLTLEVFVSDYFGQALSNVNVTIERNGVVQSSIRTGRGGVAKFTELVGGNYKVWAYLGEEIYGIDTFNIKEPRTVKLSIGEIVSIGGFAVKASTLLSASVGLAIALSFLIALVYYNRRSKMRQKE